MKKLLLSLGFMAIATSVSAVDYVLGTPLSVSQVPSTETKVIIEGWTMASKGFMTVAPSNISVFSVLDKSNPDQLVFSENYVYTLIPVEGSTTDFYIKDNNGLYAPKASADMNTAGGLTQAGVTDITSAGTYKFGALEEITAEGYTDKYMFTNTNQTAQGKTRMEVHFKESSGAFKWCYLQTGGGANGGMANAGGATRTAAAFKVYVADKKTIDPVTVTFTYPPFGDYTPSTQTGELFPGEVELSSIPTPEYFTATGVDGVVGNGPTTLNVTGTWNFPFQLNQVFRADLRKSSANNCNNWAVVNNTISTRSNANSDDFSPENLFYLKGHGFNDDNRLIVTLHTTGLPDEEGYECSSDNSAFSANPTQWIVKKNATGTDGISLQHPDYANAHANDIGGTLGIWNAGASLNDGGSFIRFKALTDADFATTTWVHNEHTYILNHNLVAAAQANPSIDNIRAIFDIENQPNITATFNIKHNADDSKPIEVENIYLFNPTLSDLPDYPGFTITESEFVPNDHAGATYVMNEGSHFRLYNERTGKYVHVANGGLYQTETIDDSIDFIRIAAGTDGAFILYNPASDSFAGNITGTNSATAVVAFGQTPVKYYTGKQTDPIYMDWIGNRQPSASEDSGYNFFNDFQGNFVCGWTWSDAGSKWVIITDIENFETNWELRNQLRSTRASYKRALEVLGEEDVDNLSDFAENYYFDGNVNLPVSEENQEKIAKIYAKVHEAEPFWAEFVMNTDKLYTIQSDSDNRGAIIYNPDNGTLTTTGAGVKATATNENHLWGFVKYGDKHYLYNYGARKFASAYETRVGGTGTATYVWTVDDIPTAVELTTEHFGQDVAFNNNKFTIEGGKTYSTNRPGIMIINNNPQRVPCSLGEGNNPKDGTSFILTEVETPAIGEEMTAKVADGFALVNGKIDEISVLEWEADVEGVMVGHHTPEAVETFIATITADKENADKEAALYDALNAKVVFDSAEKRQVVNGHVYSISDSEGNVHYTDGADHLIGEFTNANIAYRYWVATVDENGNVSFNHTHEVDEVAPAALYYDTAAVPFTINDVTSFHVQPTAELGKMSLVNAEDNTPVDDKTYNLNFVSTEATDATTTGLTEVNAEGNAAGAIYDLQGRKLVAPVKGINIINGQKILVK